MVNIFDMKNLLLSFKKLGGSNPFEKCLTFEG